MTRTTAERDADSVFAADVEHGVRHGRHYLQFTVHRIERADACTGASARDAGRKRRDRVRLELLVAEFDLSPQRTEVVADERTQIPTFVELHRGDVGTASVDVRIFQNGDAHIETDIGLPILSHSGHGNRRCRDGQSQRNFPHVVFPFKPAHPAF